MPPNGGSVLILDDEMIVALDVESTLSGAGFSVAHTAATCAGALQWLRDNRPDMVVLDIALQDGDCDEIAEFLVTRNIPFIVFSARSVDECAPIFRKGLWLSKPSPSEMLIDPLRSLETPPRIAI